MSYAGTYGDDETCRHHHYWRSCPLCSRIGPRATEEQIAARLQKDREEERQRAEQERERCRAYDRLTPRERRIAVALWGGDEASLRKAVRGLGAYPGQTGKARGICATAKTAADAFRGRPKQSVTS